MDYKEKNVTFVIGSLLRGGAERAVTNLSCAMAEQGKDVVVLSYYDVEPVYWLNSKVKIVKVVKETGTTNILKNLIYIRRFFIKRKGIIFSFIAIFNIISIVAHLGLGSRLIVADRNNPNRVPSKTITRWIRNILYNFADVIVVQTKGNSIYFKKRVCTPIRIIYNPLELYGRAGKALTTQKKNTIVSVGRLIPQKNQAMLIKAFFEVYKSFPEYNLVIYGEGNSRNELENLINELRLSQCVDMPGNIEDIYDEISKAKLFVLSSNYEGMPNALIEAMGLGLPVISTKVSGAVDLIEDGVNGELVEIGDHIALANRIIAILKDESIQKKYGENATKLNNKLSIEKIVKKWLEIS